MKSAVRDINFAKAVAHIGVGVIATALVVFSPPGFPLWARLAQAWFAGGTIATGIVRLSLRAKEPHNA